MNDKPISFGKYLLLDRVNVGGMAEVFKAKAFGVEGFERLVAVKRILPAIAEDTEFITMFVDEAKIAVQLTHANIAQIFDLGKVDDSYFIALEYIHGKDLRAIFDRVRKRGETVPIPMCCYVIMKVCEGLDYAHNKRDPSGRDLNLVHRDVSPQNVIISYDGEVKLIDFGIAKAAGKVGTTQAGMLKGKFGYMSPEQVRGIPIDRRSDVFAVGIVLFELLTGERLFIGESDFATLEKIKNGEVIPPTTYNPRIPEELERIVLKALARETPDRYQTAMDLHDDLQSFMYTSGNFFARKDLSLFARELFAEEIARDKAKDDELQKLEAQRSTNDDVPTPAVPLDVPRGSRRAPGISQITPPTPPPSSRPPGAGTELPTRMSAAALWQAAVTEVDPSPSVQMDWDDEDMSTEIYDKPGQLRIPPTVPHPSGSQRPSASVVQPPAPRGPISIPAVVPAPEPRVASTIPPPLPVGGVSRPPPPRMISSAPGSLAAPGAQASQPGEGAFAGPPTNPTTLPPVVPSSVTMGAPARPSAPGSLAAPPTAPEAEPPAGVVAVAPAGTAPFPGPVPSVDVAATDVDQKRWPLARVLIVGGLGAFVLLAAVFVLLLWWLTPGVGSVEFASTPEDVVVGVDGKSLGARRSPHLIENLEEGAHEVSVTKPGFSPFVRKVDVVAEQVLDLGTVELAKRELPRMPPAGRAGFSLTTEPAGARVAVDGRELDQRTPMEIRTLAAGTHMIEVRPDGNYAPYKTQITLTEGQMLALPELVLQQDHVRVTFESRPSGAKVTLVRGAKSESIGETPTRADVQISLGAWTVQMEADGHTKWVGPLVVPPGHDEIRVFAELTSDGSSPQRPSHSEDEPRSSSRRPSSSDRAPAERPAQAPTTGSTGSASDAMATLQVGTTPWTQVFVDGRFIGNSPQRNIQLRPGEHRVTLVNAELNIKEPLTITLAPGETKKIVKNLLP